MYMTLCILRFEVLKFGKNNSEILFANIYFKFLSGDSKRTPRFLISIIRKTWKKMKEKSGIIRIKSHEISLKSLKSHVEIKKK